MNALSSSLKSSIFLLQRFSQTAHSSSHSITLLLKCHKLSWLLLLWPSSHTFSITEDSGLGWWKVKGFWRQILLLDAGNFLNICQILTSNFFVTYKVPFCSLFLFFRFHLNIKQNFSVDFFQNCSFPLIFVTFRRRLYFLSHSNHDCECSRQCIKINVVLSWGISEWAFNSESSINWNVLGVSHGMLNRISMGTSTFRAIQ